MPEPREHELSEDCWCEPEVVNYDDDGWETWRHDIEEEDG